MKTLSKALLVAGLGALTLATGGCGGSDPKVAKKVEKLVFTSSGDCAESGKLTVDECSALIEKAITTHVKTAPVYTSLTSCEKAEGTDKCERTDEQSYKPRLVAYAITIAEQNSASPLYASPKTEPSFRAADKSILINEKDGLIFSRSAMDISELYSGGEKKKKRGS